VGKVLRFHARRHQPALPSLRPSRPCAPWPHAHSLPASVTTSVTRDPANTACGTRVNTACGTRVAEAQPPVKPVLHHQTETPVEEYFPASQLVQTLVVWTTPKTCRRRSRYRSKLQSRPYTCRRRRQNRRPGTLRLQRSQCPMKFHVRNATFADAFVGMLRVDGVSSTRAGA
jgi:hypothetical protein